MKNAITAREFAPAVTITSTVTTAVTIISTVMTAVTITSTVTNTGAVTARRRVVPAGIVTGTTMTVPMTAVASVARRKDTSISLKAENSTYLNS